MKVCEKPHCVYGGEIKRETREKKRPERYRARKRTERDRDRQRDKTQSVKHALLRVLANIWKRKPKGRQLLSE